MPPVTDDSGLTPPPDSPPLQRRAKVSRRTLVGAGAATLLVGCPIGNPPHPPPQPPPHMREEVDIAPHPGPEPEPEPPTPPDKQPVEAVPPQTQPEPEPAPEPAPQSQDTDPVETNPSSVVGPAPDKPLVPGMKGTPPEAKPVFGTAEPKPL